MKSLSNGLARAAVRFKPASFVGTFVALMMAAMIVSACGILLETGVRASVPPTRYAGAPVVAAADQQARSGSGDSASQTPLPDRARIDNSLVAKAGSAPGARTAVADVSFPVHSATGPLTAHGWGSAQFTGTSLASGAAPRTGEVVLDKGRVGDRVTLTTADGPRDFRVSGIAKASDGTAWFADSDAVRLSGHPGKIDAIAVLPKDGVGAGELKAQVAHALGGKAEVYTGDDRGSVEDGSLAGAKELLSGLGGSFGGVATMVAVFTAAGTVALSVGQRARDFALLRAIGATPRQLRRSIAMEALLLAPVAGAVGCLPGIGLAAWWFGQLKEKGAIPEAVDLSVSFIPLVSAGGAVIVTALLAGYMAARRPSRIKPGQALAEASVERLRPGWIRTPLGIGAAVGGGLCAGLAASSTGEDAANA
ncbi:FtsX-like permease family protein, partial [Streptomyces sp. T-3]|nr:FtsX-like permease family protein [Streptomyces sp. T-3]